jgi:glycine/D-amino acid oxidase-like deaminating enzyme
VLPVMHEFYTGCEKKLQRSFLTKRALVKPFSDDNEMSFWAKKAAGNAYLDPGIYHGYSLSQADAIANYSKVLQSGNLHVPVFLQSSRDHFKAQDALLEEAFDHSGLEITATGVRYKHIDARYIIFCEGYLVHKNPFFRHIPMKPAKGEVLTIKCEGLLIDSDIFNKQLFILPLGNYLYRVGATYQWDGLNDLPTERAKTELLEKLRNILHVPFEVIHHQAGVRPSVIDRRPVLGRHHDHHQLYVFNGFGTKAVMLAPYFSGELAGFILEGRPLNGEADVRRFHKNE